MADNGGTANGDDPAIDADTDWTQVAQRHYDPDGDEELTAAIVFAVAEAEGVSPLDVKSPPMYESVDAAALEGTFFGSAAADDSRRGVGTVEFRYTDYLLKVRSDGWIQVYEQTDGELP